MSPASAYGPTDMTETRMLETPAVTLAYDVRGPLPPADGRPVLMMVGAPMDASGFTSLASHFGDRTVVTYDPRGMGRSTLHDGSTAQSAEQNAEDIHAIIAELGIAPVELFGSSGGAISGLALSTAYPEDVSVLVAHEPPLTGLLPDADKVAAAERAVQAVYQEKGWGHGMAAFLAMVSWKGEFTDEALAAPPPDPAAFGLPTEDDGSRDDPLLSGGSDDVTPRRPRPRRSQGLARTDRRRGGRGVRGPDHRAYVRRARRGARAGGGRVPRRARRVPRGRVRSAGRPGGVRRTPARGARRSVTTRAQPSDLGPGVRHLSALPTAGRSEVVGEVEGRLHDVLLPPAAHSLRP